MKFYKIISKGLIIALAAVFLFCFLYFACYNEYNVRYSEGDAFAFAELNGKLYYCNNGKVYLYGEDVPVCKGNSIKAVGKYLAVNNSLVRNDELYLYNPESEEKVSIYKSTFWDSLWAEDYVSSFFVKDLKVYYHVRRDYSYQGEIRCFDTENKSNEILLKETGVYSMTMDEDTGRLFLDKSNDVLVLDLAGKVTETLDVELTDKDGGIFGLCADNRRLYVETNDNFYVYNTDDLSQKPLVISSSETLGRFYLLSAKGSAAYGVKYENGGTKLVLVSVNGKDGTVTEYGDCVFTEDILRVHTYRPTVIKQRLWYITDGEPMCTELKD